MTRVTYPENAPDPKAIVLVLLLSSLTSLFVDMIRVVDAEKECDAQEAVPRAVAQKMCSLKTWSPHLPGQSSGGPLVPNTCVHNCLGPRKAGASVETEEHSVLRTEWSSVYTGVVNNKRERERVVLGGIKPRSNLIDYSVRYGNNQSFVSYILEREREYMESQKDELRSDDPLYICW